MPAAAAFATPADAFRAAVAHLGSQQAMAHRLGVSQPSVWRYMKGTPLLPAEHVLTVEQTTGISRYDLRPDLADLWASSDPATPAPRDTPADMEPAR